MSRLGTARSERGSALVMVAVVLIVLLAITALSVDLGVLYRATEQAQNTANAAALAGAGKLREGMDPDAAVQEALMAAANNTVLNAPVTVRASDVKVGAWNPSTRQVVAWDPTASQVAVQVTVRRTKDAPDGPVPTFFAKVLVHQYSETSRTAVAGLYVTSRPRPPVNLMIVQDGSTSFQGAWSQAIDADAELLNLINRVSIQNDAAGMVTFNASLDDNYLKQSDLYSLYKPYPEMNRGIKYTTDSSGRPRKTTDTGVTDNSRGLVRPMIGALTDFNIADHSNLSSAMDKACLLLKAGKAWGDTDTAAGLNYAIDSLNARGGQAEKVIVLVSDGMPHDYRGSYYTSLRTQAAVTAANRAGASGIRIHTVTLEGAQGVNFSFNESLIRNGGYALRAADASKLRDLLIAVGAIEIGHPCLLK